MLKIEISPVGDGTAPHLSRLPPHDLSSACFHFREFFVTLLLFYNAGTENSQLSAKLYSIEICKSKNIYIKC